MVSARRTGRRAAAKLTTLTAMTLLLIGLKVDEAHAYLDPGTGSILLQSTLALIAGTAVTLRLYWSKLKSFISRGKPPSNRQAGSNE
jgi:hypothetical protein